MLKDSNHVCYNKTICSTDFCDWHNQMCWPSFFLHYWITHNVTTQKRVVCDIHYFSPCYWLLHFLLIRRHYVQARPLSILVVPPFAYCYNTSTWWWPYWSKHEWMCLWKQDCFNDKSNCVWIVFGIIEP